MKIGASHIILYVVDQEISKTFYTDLLNQAPVRHVTGMTEFELNSNVILGLMPNSSIARIITPTLPNPSEAVGIPRCEVYLYIDDLTTHFERIKNSNVQMVSPLENRNWGDSAFYVADPDGHVIAFAEREE